MKDAVENNEEIKRLNKYQGQRWQNHTNSNKSKMPRSRELSPSATDWGTPTKRGRLKKSAQFRNYKSL